jgi:Leucine rich repeat
VNVLQIFHLKDNLLTGTIPAAFGDLPYLLWFDISQNLLLGTIPSSFGKSQSIEDFRLAGNMLYDAVPHGLCINPRINGGATKQHGCDGVLCPAGTYAETGHATDDQPCIKCPDGQSNLYIGSLTCNEISEVDILSILYEVLQGAMWPEDKSVNWSDPSKSVCEWAGIDCDSNGEITSISFPLLAATDL